NRDCFRGVLEQCGEVDVLGLESVVKAFPIGDIDGDADGAGDSSVRRAQRLDARLERASAPIGFVAHQLTLKRAEVRAQRSEARIASLQHFVQRHSNLFVGAGADEMETGSL